MGPVSEEQRRSLFLRLSSRSRTSGSVKLEGNGRSDDEDVWCGARGDSGIPQLIPQQCRRWALGGAGEEIDLPSKPQSAFQTVAPPCKPVSQCTSPSPGAQFGSRHVLLLLLSCSVILKPNNSTFMAFCPVLKCAHISRESYESLEFHDNLVEGQIHQQTARGSVWKLSCHRHLVHSMALPISILRLHSYPLRYMSSINALMQVQVSEHDCFDRKDS